MNQRLQLNGRSNHVLTNPGNGKHQKSSNNIYNNAGKFKKEQKVISRNMPRKFISLYSTKLPDPIPNIMLDQFIGKKEKKYSDFKNLKTILEKSLTFTKQAVKDFDNYNKELNKLSLPIHQNRTPTGPPMNMGAPFLRGFTGGITHLRNAPMRVLSPMKQFSDTKILQSPMKKPLTPMSPMQQKSLTPGLNPHQFSFPNTFQGGFGNALFNDPRGLGRLGVGVNQNQSVGNARKRKREMNVNVPMNTENNAMNRPLVLKLPDGTYKKATFNDSFNLTNPQMAKKRKLSQIHALSPLQISPKTGIQRKNPQQQQSVYKKPCPATIFFHHQRNLQQNGNEIQNEMVEDEDEIEDYGDFKDSDKPIANHKQFWGFIDSLFKPLHNDETIKALRLDSLSNDDPIFQVPELGDHYTKKWALCSDDVDYEIKSFKDSSYSTRSRRGKGKSKHEKSHDKPKYNIHDSSSGYTNDKSLNVDLASDVFEDPSTSQRMICSLIEESKDIKLKRKSKRKNYQQKRSLMGQPVQEGIAVNTQDYTAQNLLTLDENIEKELNDLSIFEYVEKDYEDEIEKKLKKLQDELKVKLSEQNKMKTKIKLAVEQQRNNELITRKVENYYAKKTKEWRKYFGTRRRRKNA